MSTINKKNKSSLFTHEGGIAKQANKAQTLRRLVNACMLWEDSFYVDGVTIADQIAKLVSEVPANVAQDIAIRARTEQKLRHVPLLVAREMARASKQHRLLVADTLYQIIQRPDELTEFLSIYWKDGKQPLSAQVKKGLALAFTKFNEYSLAKYNQDKSVKLRDVAFLTHPNPIDLEQESVFARLVNKTFIERYGDSLPNPGLVIPDTWETQLSAGKDKAETFTRLIMEGKLGALALLRNLRNMIESGVNKDLIKQAIVHADVEKVLPFRFISAAKCAPNFEPELEQSMLKCLEKHDKLEGKTVLLVDVSGSMQAKVSGKSDISRLDAACGLAMLLREIGKDVNVYTFSNKATLIPARRGFALADVIKSLQGGGTYLAAAINVVSQNEPDADRVIVISDEQSADNVINLFKSTGSQAYMVNVASYKNGVSYGNGWKHIDGWSESIIDYIMTEENGDESTN